MKRNLADYDDGQQHLSYNIYVNGSKSNPDGVLPRLPCPGFDADKRDEPKTTPNYRIFVNAVLYTFSIDIFGV
ncbi:MAG: hypothetical protein WD824_03270 [Cyclobacteriaceae bacterium]